MADMSLYTDYSTYPVVDHMHQRLHQHQPLVRFNRKPVDPSTYPNHPDVDIRDAGHEYLIEIEVPGIKDPDKISCQWTGSKSIVVSGTTERPAWSVQPETRNTGDVPTRDAQSKGSSSQPTKPFLLIGERRIGPWQRHISFPFDVKPEGLHANLEAGLLKLRVPQKSQDASTRQQKIKIMVEH